MSSVKIITILKHQLKIEALNAERLYDTRLAALRCTYFTIAEWRPLKSVLQKASDLHSQGE